jgi:hypothetical protein
MKFEVAATTLALWATSSVTTAFAPPSVMWITPNTRSITSTIARTPRGALIVRYAGPEEEEEAGLDLDLSEMFEL